MKEGNISNPNSKIGLAFAIIFLIIFIIFLIFHYFKIWSLKFVDILRFINFVRKRGFKITQAEEVKQN